MSNLWASFYLNFTVGKFISHHEAHFTVNTTKYANVIVILLVNSRLLFIRIFISHYDFKFKYNSNSIAFKIQRILSNKSRRYYSKSHFRVIWYENIFSGIQTCGRSLTISRIMWSKWCWWMMRSDWSFCVRGKYSTCKVKIMFSLFDA